MDRTSVMRTECGTTTVRLRKSLITTMISLKNIHVHQIFIKTAEYSLQIFK